MIHPLYLVYDYNENTGNMEGRSFKCMKGMCLFTSHFCLFFATMYDDLFITDPMQSVHWMGTKWTYEGITYRGFDY